MKSLQELLAQSENKPVKKPTVKKKSSAKKKSNPKKAKCIEVDEDHICDRCSESPETLTGFGQYHPFNKHLKVEGYFCDGCLKVVEEELAKEYLETYGVSHVEKGID